MEKIEFKDNLASDLIRNLKAARFVALIDFWVGIIGIVFFILLAIYSIVVEDSQVGIVFLFFIPLYIMATVYGGSYLTAYNNLKKNKLLYKTTGIVEKRIMFPFYLTVSGFKYKGIHQLLNYARQMGKETTFYHDKYYVKAGDKVEIIYINRHILKIRKID